MSTDNNTDILIESNESIESTALTDSTESTESTGSTEFIIDVDDLDLRNYTLIKKIILHIETNILGRLSEIIRYLTHYILIFDIITAQNNELGQECYNLLNIEITQLSSIFNINHNKFSTIIKLGDKKQYDDFVFKHIRLKQKIMSLNEKLTNFITNIKFDMTNIIEHTLSPKIIDTKNNNYKENLKKYNSYINDIKTHLNQVLINKIDNNGSLKNIEWCVKPSNKCSQKKNRKLLCSSSVFNLSHDEYKDLIEDEKLFDVHKPSRRYRCQITPKSASIFINKCLENAFPKISKINNIANIELYCICINTKSCIYTHNTDILDNVDETDRTDKTNVVGIANISIQKHNCDKHIDIIDIIQKLNLSDEYKNQIIELKKSLIQKYYNVNILNKCPKPNCPNGDGFISQEILEDIIIGKISQNKISIHKCSLCNSIWCSKCFKLHPGKLCSDIDDDNLGTTVKKCPNCFIPCERDGGCFHINCTKCKMHWCWDCNYFTPQSDAYKHKCLKGEWITLETTEVMDV